MKSKAILLALAFSIGYGPVAFAESSDSKTTITETTGEATSAPMAANAAASEAVTAAPPAKLSTTESETRKETLKADLVLRAMQDELDRTMTRLHLPNHPLPYFGSYEVIDSDNYSISAAFGAIEHADGNKHRRADITLRVGDKKVDNTASRGATGLAALFANLFAGASGSTSLVVDDDYDALRFNLWMQTDKAYKRAIESLQSAKASLSTLNIEDKPDCWSDAPPAVLVENPAKPNLNREEWTKRIQELSAVMKKYPEIKSSRVYMHNYVRTRRFINSEGTLMRTPSTVISFGIWASAECKDGMTVHDTAAIEATSPDKLPDQAELTREVEKLCQRVVELYHAKRAEHYVGPVLFEKSAAAEFASCVLPPLVCAKRPSLSVSDDEDQVLDKKILPKSVTIIDDATATTYNGQPLQGGWTVDFEGVRPTKLTLVENGVLKTLCSNRVPNRVITASNGHDRGRGPTPSHLFLTTTDTDSFEALKTKLIAMGKEQDLDSVIIVRRSEPYTGMSSSQIMGMFNTSTVGKPVMVYKVDVATGKEELIRGAHFGGMPKRGLKEFQLASDDGALYPVDFGRDDTGEPLSLFTPSILVKELEITKPPRTSEVPPYLKDPYFDGK